VYLLRSLSVKFPSLSIRVEDSDGQFLLIEAADDIPSWLQPDTAHHRVWLRNGRLHIIPRPPRAPRTPAELVARSSIKHHPLLSSCGHKLTQSIALEVLSSGVIDTLSPLVEASVNRRLADFPKCAIDANHHYVRVLLPLTGARVLRHSPELISNAVESFYLRDPIDMKACHKMARFLPAPTPTTTPSSTSSSTSTSSTISDVPMVWSRVRFTRCLYAQLNSQNFHAPKTYRMPSDIRSLPIHDRRRLGAELGLKLVCGLEILYQNQLRKQATRMKKRAAEAAIREQRRIREAKGGIKGPINEPIHPGDIEDESINLAATIDIILGVSSSDEKKGASPPSSTNMSVGLVDFSLPYHQLPDDSSDAWMSITPQQIDDIFAQRNQPRHVHDDGKPIQTTNATTTNKVTDKSNKGKAADGEEMDLNTLVDSMSAFVEKVSGHRGAEVPLPRSSAKKATSSQTGSGARSGGSKSDNKNGNGEPDIEVNYENVMKMLSQSAAMLRGSGSSGVTSNSHNTTDATNAVKPSKNNRQQQQQQRSEDSDDDNDSTDGDPFRRRYEYVRDSQLDDDNDDLDELDDHEADDNDDDLYRDDDLDDDGSHAGLSSLSFNGNDNINVNSSNNNSNISSNGVRHPGREPQIADYMQQMDRELRQAGVCSRFPFPLRCLLFALSFAFHFAYPLMRMISIVGPRICSVASEAGTFTVCGILISKHRQHR
jgi:hypothetical protein